MVFPEHSPPLPLSALRSRALIVNEAPNFERPDSQFVSAEQICSLHFQRWCRVFGRETVFNRKIWEYLYILNTMDQFVGLRPGTRALGFGVGRERIVSLLAELGCDVVATDYSEGRDTWPKVAQTATDLFHPDLCSEESFRSRVSLRNVDMNRIPSDLRDFDCLWSCGSLEHMGGHRNGLDFIQAAMECLRPGGIAVHTTEFNLVSDELTHQSPNLSFYRRRDIVALAERLLAEGHQIVLNFTRGDTPVDLHIDQDPVRNSTFSLTAQAGMYVITSIGLIVQKRLDGGMSATRSCAQQQTIIEGTSLSLSPAFTELRRPNEGIYYDSAHHGSAGNHPIFSGPCILLPSGTYHVAFCREIVGTFTLRFTGDDGRIILHEQSISSVDDPITFTSTTPVPKFEIILLGTDASERVSVDRIVLTRA